MASISVKFYSLWRQYLGVDNTTLQADGLDEALGKVEERFGSHLREQLRGDGVQVYGKIQDYSLILLNGTSLRNLKQTSLKEGDILQIFPPATGG
ncbi:MAG: MoaD/ThiS family protein [Dehalococcoidia bacterium]|nr:MoaD/ThiS family protein [Dehalococcoidia bacterium]